MRLKFFLWIFVFVAVCGFAAASLTDGLIYYFNLDNKNLTNSVAGGGNLVTDNSGSDVVAGKYPVGTNVANFNANSEGMRTAAYNLIENVSECFWFNRTANSVGYWSRYAPTSEHDYFDIISMTSPNGVRIEKLDGAAAYVKVDIPITTNIAWHHLCMVKNGTHIWGYLDGVLNGTSSGTAGVTGTNTDTIKIGESVANNPNVAIDEFALWNRTLSAAEVLSVYGGYYPFASNETPSDTAPPNITIVAPSNSTFYSNIDFNVSIDENGSCLLNVSDIWYSMSNYSGSNRNFTATLPNTLFETLGSYKATFKCNDTTGNTNTTQYREFQTDAYAINSCVLLNASTNYELNENVDSASAYCIETNNINSQLFGNNYVINSTGGGTAGVYLNSNSTGIKIKNLELKGWDYGVILEGSRHGKLSNLTILNVDVYSIEIKAGTHPGHIPESNYSIINSNIFNLTFATNENGDNSTRNNIYNNIFHSEINWAISENYLGNYWNSSKSSGWNIMNGTYFGGNYWVNPSGTGFSQLCRNLNNDSICDVSYSLGMANNTDYLPLTNNTAGINITFFDAMNGSTINLLNGVFQNGTDSVNLTNLGSIAHINWDVLPKGNLTLILSKSGIINATFNINNINRSDELQFKVYLSQHIFNISYYDANTSATFLIPVNLTAAPYLNGSNRNLTFSYVADDGTSGTLCSNCRNFSGNVSVATFGNHTINITGANDVYSEVRQFFTTQYYAAINITFIDERTLNQFDINGTNSTTFMVICDDGRIQQYDVKGSGLTNISDFYVECNYTKFKTIVSYPTANYYRSLIPKNTESNQTFYLVNLLNDAAVSIALQFEGLESFNNPSIELTNGNRIIIKDVPDVQNKIVAYLMQNYEYVISVYSGTGDVRVLGNLVADASGTKVVRLNALDLIPEYSLLFGNVFTTYEINETYIRASYYDASGTSSVVNLTIFNFSTGGDILWSSQNTGNNITFTWLNAVDNSTIYVSRMKVSHAVYGEFNETQSMQVGTSHYGSLVDLLDEIPDVYREDAEVWKSYLVIIFLILLTLVFGSASAKVGIVVVSTISIFFWYIGWLNLKPAAIVLICALLIGNILGTKRT